MFCTIHFYYSLQEFDFKSGLDQLQKEYLSVKTLLDRYEHVRCCCDSLYEIVITIIGASLSEPHTSVTALHVCVYVLLACGHELNERMFKFAHVLKPNSCSVNKLHADGSTENDCAH